MGQNETPNTTDCTLQEFDFTGTHDDLAFFPFIS